MVKDPFLGRRWVVQWILRHFVPQNDEVKRHAYEHPFYRHPYEHSEECEYKGALSAYLPHNRSLILVL